MPETTTNLGLTKPLETELYDVGVFNANADIIDSSFNSLDGHLEYMQNLTNSLQEYLFSSPETTDLRGSEFDFSAKRGVLRKAYLYDSTTEFTDAPSLPEVSDGEIGEFYFEAGMAGSAVEDAVDVRYTQLVACTDSGPVFVRDGEYGSWSDWREVTAYALSGEMADLTAINQSIAELQTADAELRTQIASNYTTLYNLIEDLQATDETLNSNIGSLSSTVSTNYTTLTTLISNNYESLSTTITSNYNELSESISDLSDTVSSNYETLSTSIAEKAGVGTVSAHVNNSYIHITTDERTLWNSGISYSLPSDTLPEDADADDYTTDGQYKATSASTLTNFAQSTYGFELIVMHTVSSNRGMQIMLCSNGDVYVRAFNSANSSGTFYGMSWKQLTS